MKEMCRNFLCNKNPQSSSIPNSPSPSSAAVSVTTARDNCSACVQEQIGLAQAYVAAQPYETPIDQEQSLICGTVFSDLIMPYCSGWNLYRFKKEG